MSTFEEAEQLAIALQSEAERANATPADTAHGSAIEGFVYLAIADSGVTPSSTVYDFLYDFGGKVRQLPTPIAIEALGHIQQLWGLFEVVRINSEVVSDATVRPEDDDAPAVESIQEDVSPEEEPEDPPVESDPASVKLAETELEPGKNPFEIIAEKFELEYKEELRILHEIFNKDNSQKQVGKIAPSVYSKIELVLEATRKNPELADEVKSFEFRFLQELVAGKNNGEPLGALSAAGKLKRELEAKGRTTFALINGAPKYLAQLLTYLKD